MKAQEFPEVNVRIAESQEEYGKQVGKTGKIWIKQLIFNKEMQPIAGTCLKESLIPQE